ncbi:hypothetical protein Sjap_008306 [Stephania japonica]|uniref:Uncharacterized protein n=1 Tax=Stephania japonica TaxID=461633 RepID=A0AAP0JPD0_9MAGN
MEKKSTSFFFHGGEATYSNVERTISPTTRSLDAYPSATFTLPFDTMYSRCFNSSSMPNTMWRKRSWHIDTEMLSIIRLAIRNVPF